MRGYEATLPVEEGHHSRASSPPAQAQAPLLPPRKTHATVDLDAIYGWPRGGEARQRDEHWLPVNEPHLLSLSQTATSTSARSTFDPDIISSLMEAAAPHQRASGSSGLSGLKRAWSGSAHDLGEDGGEVTIAPTKAQRLMKENILPASSPAEYVDDWETTPPEKQEAIRKALHVGRSSTLCKL